LTVGREKEVSTMKRLALLAALVLLPVLACPTLVAAQGKELLLFNWSNYMPPELLKRFEAETGIKVTLDVYDTNETMLAKLQAGGTGYDIVVPSGPTLQQMIRDGMLVNVDVGKMSNFKNVRKPFDKPEYDPERGYSAPYLWGSTGIAYDTARVTGGKLEDSWKELFDPRPELVGKVGMLSDLGEVFVAAAHYLGIDICTEKPEDGQKILDVLTRQKPAVKLYNASGTADRVGAGEVAMQHMWNGAFFRAHKKLATLAYIYPKEGLNLWGDNFAVPKGARNVENAKLFINWMMEPKNIAEASNALGYNNAIAGSSQYFIDAMKDEPAINTPEEMVSRLKPTRVCGKANTDMRNSVWTRLRR
jgi:spermidine/putrescine transport system substrate-binding protein